MALPPMGVEAVIKGLPSYLRGMQQMGDSTSKTSGILGKVGGIATAGFKAVALGATAAVGAVGALGGAMFKLAMDAAPLEGVGQAFAGLTADMEGGADAMLKSLQEASYGMTTNADLMKSFNLAAQLVSKDFAEQLPDAMQYLGKVAAATGQDMGYLMDSLVRGVGRLSPMILDNLAIQVDLTTAYEDWAKVNGRTVDSMTKTEQQAAVMAQVMAKLAENTALMPEVAGSAQQGFASFGVQLKNFKDELGLALLPVAGEFLGIMSDLAKKILPVVADFVKRRIIPIFETFAGIVKKLVGGEFKVEDIIPPWIFNVWEDFMGVIDKFRAWWERNGPAIKESAGKIFDTLVDTMNKLAQNIIPWLVEQFNKVSGWFDEHEDQITGAIESIANFFENTLGPAVTNLWNNVLGPFLGDFMDLLLGIGGAILDVFAPMSEEEKALTARYTLEIPKTPFEKLTEVLEDFFFVKFPEIFKSFRDWVLDFFGLPNWQTVADSWKGIWDNLLTIIDWFITESTRILTGWLDDVQLIMRAIQFDPTAIGEILSGGLSAPTIPSTDIDGDIPGTPHISPIPWFGGTSSTTNQGDNYNLNIYTSAPTENVVADFRMMRSLAGRV